MYKRGKVKAKESNEILKANNTFAKFIKDKQYDFVTRSNGNYVIIFSSKKTHRLACEMNCLLIFYC